MTAGILILMSAVFALRVFAAEPPTDWIDPDTGHRIIRLSREPGSESLYFHQNAFTAGGDKMVMTTPEGIATYNWKTHAIDVVVPESAHTNISHGIIVGRKSREVFYVRQVGGATVAFATHLDTHATREIGKIPGRASSVLALNSDETLLAGSFVLDGAENVPVLRRRPNESKGAWMEKRVQARVPMRLFTMDTRTGKVNTFHDSTDWLNHVQMSPTDPSLILFCHEGPWHWVDRSWVIRADGSGLKQIHKRTMEMEIEGHEFFGPDGKTVWYDLQTPRGEDFWLAGCQVETGERTWYHLQRNEWSVHYNISPDGKLFAGDGGSSGAVAHAPDGKWIYLFRPELIHNRPEPGAKPDHLIRPGVFHSERLVNMSKHDYSLEPNVNFTPDGKWIVFRSNMFGAPQVFAVEVAKAGK
ncbi:MAG TPA: oligogalacturonate lyase family protein [Verrucomicrobiae bacterium]|nr:oligogalacturonate lyase family protein [Verrucomicrobiae bacterium]